MKTLTLALLASLSLSAFAVDWKNPTVICPEKAVAQGLPCLNLSEVANPNLDFPDAMTAEEVTRWKTDWASDLKVCRANEVLKREAHRPGSFTALQVQISFMNAGAGKNAKDKLKKMEAAAVENGMPIHALIGALTQESLLSDLGMSPDGGNYSCGIGQLNVSEWCKGMNALPLSEQQALRWPKIQCELVTPAMLTPFYKIASTRLNGRPTYQIDASDFSGITQAQVVAEFPEASAAAQTLRFQALTSFIQNCQNYALGIKFKAYNLRTLFEAYVPAKLRKAEMYGPGEALNLSCQNPNPSRFYPLHTGWLLTLAIYNAGPSMAKLLEHYYQAGGETLPALKPNDLIEALYWGGEFHENDGRIHYQGANQRSYSQTWTKSCVVQRHVSRVIQHVTRPGVVLASSLEEIPCAQGISETRKNASGVKE